MSNVLAVGIAVVDIVNTVEHYPAEDDELRATKQSIQRGGNASNSLVVLSQLGHQCSWCGTISDDAYASVIRDDLSHYSIDVSNAILCQHASSPLSCITMSENSGKRSIVHFRNLPELDYSGFSKMDISTYDWIHFEGRNIDQTELMLQAVRKSRPGLPVSIEIEKPREDIERLYPFSNILFFSRVFVEQQGFNHAKAFLMAMHNRYPDKEHYCGWGDQGAYAINKSGEPIHVAATAGINVVDTVGAGDVFNAGIIDAKIKHLSLQDSLSHACGLAGKKCAQYGFENLDNN